MSVMRLKIERFLRVFWMILIPCASQSALIQMDQLWPKSRLSLRVCYAQSISDLKDTAISFKLIGHRVETVSDLSLVPFHENLKPLIQHAVEASFTSAKTGITFVGWKNCSEEAADVVVFYDLDHVDENSNEPLQLAAGTRGKSKDFSRNSIRINDSALNGFRNGLSTALKDLSDWHYGPTDSIEKNWDHYGQYVFVKNMVHEFGHVAGLRHEHERFNLTELRAYDTSIDHYYSEDLDSKNTLYQKNHEYVSRAEVQEFGVKNPNSSMHYFQNLYEIDAEKTFLICQLVDRTDLGLFAKLHLLGLFTEMHLEGDFNPRALKKAFCTDRTWVKLMPKTEFEQGTLLDSQSQSALKSVYTGSEFKDLTRDEISVFNYIQTRWVSLNQGYW